MKGDEYTLAEALSKLDQLDVSNRILQQTAHEQHREFTTIERHIRDLRKIVNNLAK